MLVFLYILMDVNLLKADRTLSQEEYLIYRRSLYIIKVIYLCGALVHFVQFSVSYFVIFNLFSFV